MNNNTQQQQDDSVIGKLIMLLVLFINFLSKLLAPNENQRPVEIQEVVTQESVPKQNIQQNHIQQSVPIIIQVQQQEPIQTPKQIEQKNDIKDQIETNKESKQVQSTETSVKVQKQTEVKKETVSEVITLEVEAPTGAIGDRLNKANKAKERKILTLERKRPAPKRTRVTASMVFSTEDLDKIEKETQKLAIVDVPKGDFDKLERRSHADIWRKPIDPNDIEVVPKLPPLTSNGPPPPPPPSGAPPPPPPVDSLPSKSTMGRQGAMGVSLSQILGARSGLRKTGEELK